MSGRAFVDTNVFVYAFDRGERAKQRRALETLGGRATTLVTSTQVLQEFYVAVTRKLARPLEPASAAEALDELARLPVVHVDVAMIRSAVVTSQGRRISFWDALVVEAARSGGCDRLLSEDLQDGQDFRGVVVENPFRR